MYNEAFIFSFETVYTIISNKGYENFSVRRQKILLRKWHQVLIILLVPVIDEFRCLNFEKDIS